MSLTPVEFKRIDVVLEQFVFLNNQIAKVVCSIHFRVKEQKMKVSDGLKEIQGAMTRVNKLCEVSPAAEVWFAPLKALCQEAYQELEKELS